MIDALIQIFDQGLRTVFAAKQSGSRSYPGADLSGDDLSVTERKHSAGLMRVNHAGEICAQALYQGQAMTATLTDVREAMLQAAQEENEHLFWCETRLRELNSVPSLLNTAWYVGSWTIGAVAGWMGDKWSLGFVAETERQVVRHLQDHLDQLPRHDASSRAILLQMKSDEATHATMAIEAGGVALPWPIPVMMTYGSRVMTWTSYYI